MTATQGRLKVYDPAQPLNIGVLLIPPVQLLDLAPVDLFHMLSKEYISAIPMFPDFIKGMAFSNLKIHYIAEDQEESRPSTGSSVQRTAPLTADLTIALTASFETPQVAPGQLDILVIPGPDPTYTPTEAQNSFLRKHFETGTTDIITVCTGIYPAGYSGILDGKTATGPRGILPDLKSKFHNSTKWTARRWQVDTIPSSATAQTQNKEGRRPAELWTSAEISNGHDVIAAYIKLHFPTEIADMICAMADVGDRGQDHGVGMAKNNAWWAWLMLRSLVKSLVGGGSKHPS